MNNQENPDLMLNTRSKRDQYVFEIRKQKTNEIVNAKRMRFANQILNKENNLGGVNENQGQQNANDEDLDKITFEQLTNDFADGLQKNDFHKLFKVVETIRKKISVLENPPLEKFIATGLFPYILQLLDERFKEYRELQSECLWVVSNSLAGNSQLTKSIFSDELVRILMKIANGNDQVFAESVNRKFLAYKLFRRFGL